MQAMPLVDPFTELGKPRSKSDMDREYQRLLARDRNPFAFLYKGMAQIILYDDVKYMCADFRRQWGTYQSTYLLAKLSILLIIAVIDPDNCLFRTLPRNNVGIVRQNRSTAGNADILLDSMSSGTVLGPCKQRE
jgi:hypothetical protein